MPGPFVPLVYRLCGTRQISPGKRQQTLRRPVASTPVPPTNIGLSLLGASLPGTDALRRFIPFGSRRTPMTSTRHALAGPPRLCRRWGPGAPGPRPCLFGVGFPSSGPRVWIFLLSLDCLLSVAHAGRTSSRRPPLRGGASHRTGQVLFTSGSSGRQVVNPAAGRVTTSTYPSASESCTGAAMGWCRARHRSTSETSPRSAKYALRSPRSTAGLWLSAHKD